MLPNPTEGFGKSQTPYWLIDWLIDLLIKYDWLIDREWLVGCVTAQTHQRRKHDGDRGREALDDVVGVLHDHRHYKTPKGVKHDRHPHGVVVPARAKERQRAQVQLRRVDGGHA